MLLTLRPHSNSPPDSQSERYGYMLHNELGLTMGLPYYDDPITLLGG